MRSATKMPNHDQQANPFCSREEDLDGEIYKYFMSYSYYDEDPCYDVYIQNKQASTEVQKIKRLTGSRCSLQRRNLRI